MAFYQAEFDVRCEWGLRGLQELGPSSGVVVIVDVLSFTTAVEVATARSGIVFPYPFKNDSAAAYADSINANLASPDRTHGFSLSPQSLLTIPPGYRLVLPSPNGGALFFGAVHPILLAACCRNAAAVARAATRLGPTVSVIPAGEMWPDGSLRPSMEDLIGAGAVISALPGSRSPEAALAVAVFDHFRKGLLQTLRESVSGKELIDRSLDADIHIAAELNVSEIVPRLVDHAFVPFEAQ